MLNGNPVFVKGLCYYPIPIGYEPSVKYEQYRDTVADRAVWERDLNLISAMGGNAIRMYGFDNSANHTAFFDAALAKGIYIFLQYWWDTSKSLDDPSIVSGFTTMITNQRHPAVAMWIIHNELNMNDKYGSQLPQLFNLMDKLYDIVVSIDGINHRPVTTTLANVNNMLGTIQTYNTSKIDVWSVQIYNGASFGTFFRDYEKISSKPVLVTEFGVDGYDETLSKVDEESQKNVAVSLFQELYDNRNVTSGGALFSYVDEWWKCTDPTKQDPCSFSNSNFPDGKSNEEYFGIFKVSKTSGADSLTPKAAVAALTSLWSGFNTGATTGGATTGGATTGGVTTGGVTTATTGGATTGGVTTGGVTTGGVTTGGVTTGSSNGGVTTVESQKTDSSAIRNTISFLFFLFFTFK